ncbi:hypothetical protein COCSUDRAFT_57820 [Coccomyxa subellipsoidea C-169]|uniref:Uncharacterized protein n=1 Tax=Coccomyxa subellipsoidea (strain C-169) TaxID=574566 RepID=I0YNY1_COCSC|nr:hypothetical protein COCSUDRAFT_57820 [Coccomyxa subellipsoidea C-169]EIE20100.1 hypothetical protein COCSUDRAFT_57820 [Coccomyxa subellipsoidea C-169]|eukprot:XP_005644644.1 hypothetical protein COCSUDRAFT_57820 [Coccomyxa subellipsoidea C-169]
MLPSPPPEEVLRAAAFYRLHSELTAPDSNHSLLACALSASSTDNPEESVENVLTPLHRFNPALGVRSGSYWSSRGSEDESSTEWLALRLAHPLCLVSAVSIMPFLAFFQRGHPIYAPKAARFVFSCGEDVKARPVGSTPDSDTDEDPETAALLEEAEEAGYATIRSCARFSAWETRTEAFPMSQSDELQMFEFKRPILCVGGLVKIELLGRTQRQEQDNAWYTCINHVRVLGKPLHNFVPASPQTQDRAEGSSSSSAPKRCPQQGVKIEGVPLVLEARREDPMVARGGLMALSEGGLLLQRLATEAQGEGTADYDTDDELIADIAHADVIGPHLAEVGLEFEWLAGGQPMPPWIAHPPQPPQQQQAPADGED